VDPDIQSAFSSDALESFFVFPEKLNVFPVVSKEFKQEV